MAFEFKSLLPSPEEIKAEFPLAPEAVRLKAEKDKEIAKVFTGESDKFLVIIGPCSADREDAVCEYVTRLAKVQEKVKDRLILIPRVYTNKPRTTGGGYKGMPASAGSGEEAQHVRGTCGNPAPSYEGDSGDRLYNG